MENKNYIQFYIMVYTILWGKFTKYNLNYIVTCCIIIDGNYGSQVEKNLLFYSILFCFNVKLKYLDKFT